MHQYIIFASPPLYFQAHTLFCAKSLPMWEPGSGESRILYPSSSKYVFGVFFPLRAQVVRKWKNLGKVLCRLLRMSDYWFGFASDGILLSNEERATRRISVLQQVCAYVGGCCAACRGGAEDCRLRSGCYYWPPHDTPSHPSRVEQLGVSSNRITTTQF